MPVSSSEPIPYDEAVLDADLDVVKWRRHILIRAGYSDEDALELAPRPHVDLHVAVSLVGEGCPHKTAVRILR
jgi:hypothetical protein